MYYYIANLVYSWITIRELPWTLNRLICFQLFRFTFFLKLSNVCHLLLHCMLANVFNECEDLTLIWFCAFQADWIHCKDQIWNGRWIHSQLQEVIRTHLEVAASIQFIVDLLYAWYLRSLILRRVGEFILKFKASKFTFKDNIPPVCLSDILLE
jgi:hypothetical protein